MRSTTVLLDAGGVILDESEHERIRIEIATEVLTSVIRDYSVTKLYSDLEEAIESFCPRVLAYVLWKHLKPNRALFDELYGSFLSKWQERTPPLRLSTRFEAEVRTISGQFKVGIAGQYGEELLSLLERTSILDCFTYRHTQDDFQITKPDPRYLEQITRACGVDARECIMVGDRVDNDIIPAKQLGMKTVLVRVGLHKNQQPRIPFEIPDAELNCVSGLADAVLMLAEDT